MPFASMLLVSQYQDVIQINFNMNTLASVKEEYELVSKVKALGVVVSLKAKPSNERAFVAKQTIKIMVMCKNRNM